MPTGDGYNCIRCGQYVFWNHAHQCPAWAYTPYANQWQYTPPTPNYYSSNMLILQLEEDKREARAWACRMFARWIAAEKKATENKFAVSQAAQMLVAMREYRAATRAAERDLRGAQVVFRTGIAVRDAEIQSLRNLIQWWSTYSQQYYQSGSPSELGNLLTKSAETLAKEPL